MSAPAKALAARLDIRQSTRVAALRRDAAGWCFVGEGCEAGPFDTVVVAVPAEQAAPLIRPWQPDAATAAEATPAEPCWTVMAVFPERLAIDADVVKRQGPIGWAARDSAKPGRSGPESWVVQADPDWSRRHLEEAPATIIGPLLDALATVTDRPLPAATSAAAHRWRFARSGSLGGDALWDRDLRLGVCGDWLIGPRIEAAWLSGRRLADVILAR
jgi:predicted NAD/FAD-dependent oxidoreductase